MKQELERYRKKHLSKEELEIITKKLIQIKFEIGQKEKWTKQLAEQFQITRMNDDLEENCSDIELG